MYWLNLMASPITDEYNAGARDKTLQEVVVRVFGMCVCGGLGGGGGGVVNGRPYPSTVHQKFVGKNEHQKLVHQK